MRAAASISAAVLLTLAVTPAAIACVPAQGWPDQASLDPKDTARELVGAAAAIDIAVVESLSDDFEVGTTPEAIEAATPGFMKPGREKPSPAEVSALLRRDWSDLGVRIHYRVVERLSGNGAERFSLNGVSPPAFVVEGWRTRTSSESLGNLNRYLWVRDLSEWEGFGACIVPPAGVRDLRILIFRDDRGRLLNHDVEVRFRGRTIRERGPAYVVVSGDDDGWVQVVREAVRERGSRE